MIDKDMLALTGYSDLDRGLATLLDLSNKENIKIILDLLSNSSNVPLLNGLLEYLKGV